MVEEASCMRCDSLKQPEGGKVFQKAPGVP